MSLATDYLLVRGIIDSTVAALGFELDPAPSVESFNERLHRRDGQRLVPHIREAIWFGCWKHPEEFGHYVLRPLPNLPDEGPKFLQPTDVPSIPFIPSQTWAIKDKISRPLIFTEGPIKSGCVYQAGGYPVGIWGTWGITVKTDDEGGSIKLCPQLTEFNLFGRNIYFGFDADVVSNFNVRQSIIRNFLALFKCGALVKLLRWPLSEGKGLDDFLVGQCGLDVEKQRKKLAELIEGAGEVAELLVPADRRMLVAELRRAALNNTELDQVTRDFARPLRVRASNLHKDAQAALNKLKPNKTAKAAEQDVAQRLEAEAEAVAENIDAFYDVGRKEYALREGTPIYQSVNEAQFKRVLRARGLSREQLSGRQISQLDIVLDALRQKKFVQYVGSLAGRDAGYYVENGLPLLVTSSPTIIEPKAGSWNTIKELFTNLLWGPSEPWFEDQQTAFYGWCQVAYNAIRARKFQPGQALAFAGPVDAGKSLTQKLITRLVGGRSAKAAMFLQGRTDFNSELFGAEHLYLEDENVSTSHPARMALAVAIKSIVANQQQPCHAKGRDIVNLCPWWRVTISLNDRSDRMLVLPPLEHEDIAGKIILLRATAYAMPMATNSVEEKAKFWQTLIDELPAFLHWLTTDFEIPGDWRDSRFGVKAWHSPALLTELEELSPALTLLELIDRLKPWQPANTSWEGTALELRGLLLDAQVTRRDAQETLRWVNACGLYLNELAQMRPERVKAQRTTYRRWFEIHAP